MKKIHFLGAIVASLIVLALPAAPALAYSSTLSLSSAGSDTINLSVSNANPNSSVQLSYTVPGSSLTTNISNFGFTNNSGFYNTTVSSSGYGIAGGSQVYVTVGGQQSNTVTVSGGVSGCYYGNCGSGLSLSQTNVSLSQNQYSYVTVSNYGGGLYVASNSNSSVVSATVSGSQISLYGLSSGSSTISICANGGQCGYIYVTVSGGSGSGLSLSQTTVNVNYGQYAYVTANNYSSGLYISSNSNSNTVSASVSGSQISLYGQNSGNSTVVICANNGQCGTVYVTVGNNDGSGSLSFSQSNISLNYGQSMSVTAYNGSSNLYLSSNSNSSAVSVSFSGNQVNLYGQNQGSSSIVVCGNNNQCGTLYATVGSGSGNSNLVLSQTSVTLNGGQNTSVNATNGSSLYVSSNSNSSIVSASASGSTLYLNGLVSGTSTITVCSNSGNMCGTVYVTVNGGTYGNLVLSQTTINLNTNQNGIINIYGNSGNSYYISSNTSPNVATATINGNTVNVYGYNTGSTSVLICQNNTSQCSTLYVTVNNNNNNGSVRFITSSLPSMTLGQYYSSSIQATGGTAPHAFSISSGSLPAGLTLSSNGQLSGTPQNSSPASFWVRAQDQYGQSVTMNFYVTISGSTGGGVLGSSTFANGTLVLESGTVYIVYRNTKTGFVSSSVFKALGFKFENVGEVGNSGLISSGYVIRYSNTSHPWGSWIKSGNTVYFVHEQGIIPVGDYGTFTSNGGSDNKVVLANSWDMMRPMLPIMQYNDYRLQ